MGVCTSTYNTQANSPTHKNDEFILKQCDRKLCLINKMQ